MAVKERREVYENARIDCSDMTLMEVYPDDVMIYSIPEILRRWEGVPGVTVEIRQRETLPEDAR